MTASVQLHKDGGIKDYASESLCIQYPGRAAQPDQVYMSWLREAVAARRPSPTSATRGADATHRAVSLGE